MKELILMKIGNKVVPDTRLPDLINAVKTLYGKFGSKEIDDETASRLLGHSTSRSGAYMQKRADLRSFSLIEPRGPIKITEIGRKVSYPANQKEEQEGLIQAVSNVELWKLIYEKYTEKGLTLPSDFWTDIRVWTELPPEEAKKAAEIVRKAYSEDTRYIKPIIEEIEMTKETQAVAIDTSTAKPQAEVEELKFGDNVRIWLPKEGIKEAWKKAKKMIDIYLGVEEEG